MMEMPAARPPRGPSMRTALPSIRISPPGSGLYAPDRIFMSVDLPAPFSPIKAWISLAWTVRSTLRNALMLKKDLETRRISRIGSLIVPPPRRADGANAFLTRVSFAGSTSLLIKQKSAAQGNIEETSGCLADATNWGIAFGTLAARGSPSQKTSFRGLAAPCARVLPGFTLENGRAQGMPGARCTRGLVCKMHKEMRTRAYRFSGGIRHPLRDGFTAYAALSPATNSSCHRHRRI